MFKPLLAAWNILSRSLEIFDLTSISLSLHCDPWSHEYRSDKTYPIVSAPRISRISVCLLDTVLNAGIKITGLNYFTTYLKLLTRVKLQYMDIGHSLLKYSELKIICILCEGKGLKTIFWLLHWPFLSEYNEIYKWEKNQESFQRKD